MAAGVRDAGFVGSADVVAQIVGRVRALDAPGERGAAFLVHGGAGTGKSTLASALARALPLASVVVRGREPGALEAAIEALELARLPARCAPRDVHGSTRALRLLLLDDVDALAPRDATSPERGAHLVARLCALLDGALARVGAPVFVIGLCSQPATVAPALCRSGRLHRQLALGLPSPAERAARAVLVAAPMLAAGLCREEDVRCLLYTSPSPRD